MARRPATRIGATPDPGTRLAGGANGPVQRGLLRRFAYGLFFRVLPDTIQLLAGLHTSRAPVNWQQRL